MKASVATRQGTIVEVDEHGRVTLDFHTNTRCFGSVLEAADEIDEWIVPGIAPEDRREYLEIKRLLAHIERG